MVEISGILLGEWETLLPGVREGALQGTLEPQRLGRGEGVSLAMPDSTVSTRR